MLLKFDRNNPLIAVINESDVATNRQVERMVNAVQKQVTEHFRPAWGLQACLVFNHEPPLAMKVIIKDKATAEDEAFWVTILSTGCRSRTSSRKMTSTRTESFRRRFRTRCLRCLPTPTSIYMREGSSETKRAGVIRRSSYEVCDPVESSTYTIDGVKVSDFVLPEWFEPEHKDGEMKMDFRGKVDGPFMLAPGGYTDVFRDGKTKTIWGPKAKKKRVRHRMRRRIANQK